MSAKMVGRVVKEETVALPVDRVKVRRAAVIFPREAQARTHFTTPIGYSRSCVRHAGTKRSPICYNKAHVILAGNGKFYF